MLIGIGIVAASVNLLGVPLMHLTVACKANACIAVAAEAASFSLMAAVLIRKNGGNVYLRMVGGAAAALLASAGFYLIGTHVAPCNYLSSFGNVGGFVVKEGLIWAAFAAVFVPFGYILGETLTARYQLMTQRAVAYYTTSGSVIVSSLAISSWAILAGL